MFFKTLSTYTQGGCCDSDWFKPDVIFSGQDYYVNINPGVIYKSFNLKDMMVWTGMIPQNISSQLQSSEGTISGHAINNLLENIKIKPYDVIYLKIGIGPNLFATGAEVLAGNYKDSSPWSGYPEPFIYSPPLKVDPNTYIPIGDYLNRRPTHCMVPIAYLTNDLTQNGESVNFNNGQDQQVLVRVICNNLMMHNFIYDGQFVSYPLETTIGPFFNSYKVSGMNLNAGSFCDCDWFRPNVVISGEDSYVNVEPGVVYRSFNLKDMMVWTGFISDDMKSKVEATEGTISGHAINNLLQNIRIYPNDIVYLKVSVNPNLYPTGAEILSSASWPGYPDPFIYNPPLVIEESAGIDTGNYSYRRQTSTIIPIAYLTDDLNQEGESVSFNAGKKQQVLVRVLCNNLMMHTFLYDGQPVAYPLEAPIGPMFNKI
jgi:hypothetical protein